MGRGAATTMCGPPTRQDRTGATQCHRRFLNGAGGSLTSEITVCLSFRKMGWGHSLASSLLLTPAVHTCPPESTGTGSGRPQHWPPGLRPLGADSAAGEFCVQNHKILNGHVTHTTHQPVFLTWEPLGVLLSATCLSHVKISKDAPSSCWAAGPLMPGGLPKAS